MASARAESAFRSFEVTGKIIFINGASSSGKSTLAAALQDALDEPFWHYSIDHLRSVLPQARLQRGDFDWKDHREAFFDGFHQTLPVLARSGNNLVVEHIVETAEWRGRLLGLLEGLDVFFVGVHCPLDELERREAARGDRRPGEARADFERVHEGMRYDVEVSGLQDPKDNVVKILDSWRSRKSPTAMELMSR